MRDFFLLVMLLSAADAGVRIIDLLPAPAVSLLGVISTSFLARALLARVPAGVGLAFTADPLVAVVVPALGFVKSVLPGSGLFITGFTILALLFLLVAAVVVEAAVDLVTVFTHT